MTNNKAQQSAEKTAEQQQALRDLLALGKKNGRLTLKEMADALSHLELESDDIDKLYETLESMGVEVETEGVLEKALGDGDDDSFEPGTVEEVPEEELIDTSAMAETFAIDDPVPHVPQGDRQGRPAHARGGGNARGAHAEGQRRCRAHRGRG